jgi:V-type H+-transporting ATPase subunit D
MSTQRMNLALIKTRLKGATTGHSLLKKKSDALTKRFRTITSKIDQVSAGRAHCPPSMSHTLNSLFNPSLIHRAQYQAKRKMGRIMQLAAFALAEATFAAGDISYQVQESAQTATFRVSTRQENVSGVILPAFDSTRIKGDADSQ